MDLQIEKVFDQEENKEMYLVFPQSGEYPAGGMNVEADIKPLLQGQGYRLTGEWTFTSAELFGFDCEATATLWGIDETRTSSTRSFTSSEEWQGEFVD